MKIWNGYQDLIIGGAGLSLGASIIGRLPASAASAGVTQGLSAAGSFFPVMGNLAGAGTVINQLNQLRNWR